MLGAAMTNPANTQAIAETMDSRLAGLSVSYGVYVYTVGMGGADGGMREKSNQP